MQARIKRSPKHWPKTAFLFFIVILTSIACDLSRFNPTRVQLGQPEPEKRQLFQGITYERIVRQSPRPMVIHVVTVDLKASGIKTLVTQGDPNQARPLSAKTTSQFLEDNNLQLAINGDAFTPWQDLGPLGYSPKPGERVTPQGFAASKGTVYSQDTDEQPTLYIYKNNKTSMNALTGKVYNAVSGFELILWNGNIRDGLNNSDTDPRTAVGLNRAGNKLIIVVVDGRQPGYSEGATLAELAQILAEHKAYSAMNLDGGGSSTLVIEGENGEPQVLNSPVHQGIPGNERPVGNHLGFSAK
ncbi:MAG: phosphodiester glycosidase family protein [Chloroflexi bacterium]|nr:phosphodiester glycosidase family protein [Chloroflexota bacterium]